MIHSPNPDMVLECIEEKYEAWLSGLKPSEEHPIFGKSNYRFVLVQGHWLLFVLKDAKQMEKGEVLLNHKELLELLDEVASTLFFFSHDYRVGEKYNREGVTDLYFRIEDILAELKEEAQK